MNYIENKREILDFLSEYGYGDNLESVAERFGLEEEITKKYKIEKGKDKDYYIVEDDENGKRIKLDLEKIDFYELMREAQNTAKGRYNELKEDESKANYFKSEIDYYHDMEDDYKNYMDTKDFNEKFYGKEKNEYLLRKEAPYYKIAEFALKNWNGMNDEEIEKFMEESKLDKDIIEPKVGAKKSVLTAANSFAKSFGLNEEESKWFLDEVFGETEDRDMSMIMDKKIDRKKSGLYVEDKKMSEIIINAVEDVHNAWVSNEDNQKVFSGKKKEREQEYQYLPTELIGWNEVKSDLAFIIPINESINGYVDDKELKEEYNNRTISFFEKNKDSIKNYDDLVDFIADGKIEYSDNWNDEIKEAFENKDFVKERIKKQLIEKGFGADKELMDKLRERGLFEAQEVERENSKISESVEDVSIDEGNKDNNIRPARWGMLAALIDKIKFKYSKKYILQKRIEELKKEIEEQRELRAQEKEEKNEINDIGKK